MLLPDWAGMRVNARMQRCAEQVLHFLHKSDVLAGRLLAGRMLVGRMLAGRMLACRMLVGHLGVEQSRMEEYVDDRQPVVGHRVVRHMVDSQRD